MLGEDTRHLGQDTGLFITFSSSSSHTIGTSFFCSFAPEPGGNKERVVTCAHTR